MLIDTTTAQREPELSVSAPWKYRGQPQAVDGSLRGRRRPGPAPQPRCQQVLRTALDTGYCCRWGFCQRPASRHIWLAPDIYAWALSLISMHCARSSRITRFHPRHRVAIRLLMFLQSYQAAWRRTLPDEVWIGWRAGVGGAAAPQKNLTPARVDQVFTNRHQCGFVPDERMPSPSRHLARSLDHVVV